jgi:hypothetical protein
MLHLVVALLVLTSASPVRPDGVTTTGVTNVTAGRCNDSELDQMEADHQVCWGAADDLIFASVDNSSSSNTNDSILTATAAAAVCKSMSTKLDCFRQSVPKCYDSEYLEKRLDSYMSDELEYAYNKSDTGE